LTCEMLIWQKEGERRSLKKRRANPEKLQYKRDTVENHDHKPEAKSNNLPQWKGGRGVGTFSKGEKGGRH